MLDREQFIKRRLDRSKQGERFTLTGECNKCHRVLTDDTRRQPLIIFGYAVTLCEICCNEILTESGLIGKGQETSGP